MKTPTFPEVLVVGMHFRGAEAKATVANFIPPLLLDLEREPTNQFDASAIKVLYKGQHIGYIEACQAVFIAPHMDEGADFVCRVDDLITKRNNLHPLVTIEAAPVD
jgi:hypothetical protein